MSNSEFAEKVTGLATPAEQFEPVATYDPDGDCIEFFAKAGLFYGERIDDRVTVYYSRETNEIVGSLIKGVRNLCDRLLERFPGFTIEIEHGCVRLEHIFLAQLWSQPRDCDDMLVMTYKKLIKVAEETGVEAQMVGV